MRLFVQLDIKSEAFEERLKKERNKASSKASKSNKRIVLWMERGKKVFSSVKHTQSLRHFT